MNGAELPLLTPVREHLLALPLRQPGALSKRLGKAHLVDLARDPADDEGEQMLEARLNGLPARLGSPRRRLVL